MIDFIKDGTEARSQRVRSPILGSIGLAFFVLNWKPLWYLFLAEQPVAIKFRFFEMNTTTYSLYIWPALAGVILALSTPWVKFAGAWLAIQPDRLLRRLQFDQAHGQKIYSWTKEAEAEIAQAKLEEARERRTIDAAKRIEEAESIEGGEAAETIIEQREQSDVSTPVENIKNLIANLSDRDIKIISVLPELSEKVRTFALSEGALEYFLTRLDSVLPNLDIVRLEAELESAFKNFERLKLASKDRQGYWTLTRLGYDLSDYIKNGRP
ncbi:hypothetical protein [Yoonia sediminilitoris]|uniref:Uncharacterized protein n=1 Tax=Yoonia sediminilitoris TaxID=1286148 RepID=A0A2T6K7M2_9RHOB|nr:hypothetical protein [Yoonia sediminilitoris]PUB10719.1 hypothetical protein C8N45_11764 [Yoonia sediminilitoris]RCW90471.1 hypothetical protein DFP92_11764 [Yoonia sediminilitoris]